MPLISGYPIGPSANLRNANLRDAYLAGANLAGASLRNASLRNAYLAGAYLARASLHEADLRWADLTRADLTGASLQEANLRWANLGKADLTGASLCNANLRWTDLAGADLAGADLAGADLHGACLSGARNVPREAISLTAVVPAEGEVTGWKKCRDGVIVKLLIPAGAKRSNATTRKCRADSARVLKVIPPYEAVSYFDPAFRYRAGEVVSVPDFNEDRWDECSAGIHFYLTREEAQSLQR